MGNVGLDQCMDAAAELGKNPVSTRSSLIMEMSRLTRNRTDEPVSRDNSQVRTGTEKYSFSLFSWPRAGLATFPS